MAVFIHYFFKNQAQINQAGFTNLTRNFTSQIMLIHSQWLMDGRPNQIKLVEFDPQLNERVTKIIHLNKKGWVIGKSSQLICQEIWQSVMSIPLRFVKQPISAVKLRRKILSKDQRNIQKNDIVCRFSIGSGQFFEYYLKNGKVISDK
ncbi:MAG: hypothetical protein COB35_13295 [Gammaproteobacteria bacterium]|nr:MAG: hypothetical protein COB35_13295 [Gammaproteobacteria bacterium]